MNNKEQRAKKLNEPNCYAYIPKAHINTPLPFPEWEIQDENGVGTGDYHSPQTFSAEMGDSLVFGEAVDGMFFNLRYGMDWDTVIAVSNYLSDAVGLVDVRKNADGSYKGANEIDYTTLTGDEFLIIPMHMTGDIPTTTNKEITL